MVRNALKWFYELSADVDVKCNVALMLAASVDDEQVSQQDMWR